MPYTSGLLIGIGETREEIVQSLLDLRALHHQYGHIQVSFTTAIMYGTSARQVHFPCYQISLDCTSQLGQRKSPV